MIQQYQDQIRTKLNQQWKMESKSPITIANYDSALTILFKNLPVYYDEITTDDLVAYCLSIPGINKRDLQITIIRAVYRIFHNINLDWKLFPYQKRKKKIQPRFSTDDVQKILNAIRNKSHQLIILTQFAAGLRVGEVVILKKKDLYMEPGMIFIDGEGISNDRFSPLPGWILEMLKHRMRDQPDHAYIWPGQGGGHLSTRTVQKILTMAKVKAGITKPGNTHGLRRGFATEGINAGNHILAIRDILGHSDVKTTQIYTHTSYEFLKTQFNPAQNLKVA